TNRTLNFIWHGMHFPNQIPYRESFIMSFLLVFIGFLTIRRIRSLGVKYVTGAVLSSAAFLILYEKFGSGNEGYLQIGVTLLFLIIQGAALHTVSNINVKKSEFFLETLLTVTMMVEMFAASLITIGLVCKHEGFTSYAPYGRNHEEVHAYVEQAEGSEGHMNFERSELYPNNVCDLQSLYNVKGLSIFSSTARESFVKYMRNFGFHNNNINGLRNAGLTRVTATLLNVRNLVEIDKTQAVPALFEQEYKGKVISSWANKDALSVGFMTDPAVIDYAPDYDNDLNVFSKTNDWVKSMGAEDDVYKPVTLIAGDTSGLMTVDRESSAMAFTTSSNVQNNEYSFNVTVKDADIGSDIYLYANSKKGGNVTITCGDKTRKFEIRSFQIISCGVFDGTPIEVYVKYSESPSSNITLYGYQLDRAGYDRMLEKFSDEQLFVSEYDTTSLSGHIDVKEDGLLFLSIPYAEGWSAVVDGENAEITPIQDALMGIRLKAGSHDISLKYTPAGFKAG
ncbi:MAG: YfhO family protein, partial [Clostridiales bacterium]|nr:YfhO family protein [Clostridiales bacterium]